MKLNEAWHKAFSFVTLKYGLLVGVVVFGIAWLIGYFKIAVFTFNNQWVQFTASGAPLPVVINVRQQATQGFIPAVGNWFLDKMAGLGTAIGMPAFTLPDFIGVLVGGIITAFLGVFLVTLFSDKLFAWIKNANIRKAMGILVFGMIASALILFAITGLDFIGTLIAILIYAAVASLVIALLMQFKPIEKVVQ